MKIKNKKVISILLICLGFGLGILFTNFSKHSKLDKYYFEELKMVKSRLLFGSSVDTKKELEDYEDKIEMKMHLDGYNGSEILKMKVRALLEANREGKKHEE